MPYWVVTTGADGEPGINGGLKPRSHPGESTVNTVGVASVDESLRAIERKGGKTVVPKMAIPGIGWLAYCSDPDGNTFGILQPDAAAK
jgi:predicted enzyme related to lactoylglutathione lyase